jgi:hypothetical protein
MKRALKITVIMFFAALIIIQFIRPDFSNPQINQAETLEATTQVPATVANILQRSCADCHSNKTVYPWYAQIAPASWFLADHIDAGRREMNFSVWKTYETRKKLRKLEETCEQVKGRMMPLPSYLWIHRDAKLTDEEIKVLCEWTESESARLSAATNGQ